MKSPFSWQEKMPKSVVARFAGAYHDNKRRAARERLLTEQAKQVTFTDAANEYLRSKTVEFRSKKHRNDWISSLKWMAFPLLAIRSHSKSRYSTSRSSLSRFGRSAPRRAHAFANE